MKNNTDMNPLPFADNIFTSPIDKDIQPTLLGGLCRKCDRYFYPEPRCCSNCLGHLENTSIGSRGIVYSFTTVRAPSALDLPVPYGLGYVDLARTGLRVLGLFDPDTLGDVKIGSRVILRVKQLGRNPKGEIQLRPCFAVDPE